MKQLLFGVQLELTGAVGLAKLRFGFATRFWGRLLDPKMGAAFCVKNIAEAECATREHVSARKSLPETFCSAARFAAR